jgi:hypothetical protein
MICCLIGCVRMGKGPDGKVEAGSAVETSPVAVASEVSLAEDYPDLPENADAPEEARECPECLNPMRQFKGKWGCFTGGCPMQGKVMG